MNKSSTAITTAFRRGYGQTEFTPSERQRRRLYCLHVVLIVVIGIVFRDQADPQPDLWAREQMSEIIAVLDQVR